MLDSVRRYDVNDVPLRECPHCSAIFTASEGLHKSYFGKSFIVCPNCKAQTSEWNKEANAISAWNRGLIERAGV